MDPFPTGDFISVFNSKSADFELITRSINAMENYLAVLRIDTAFC